MNTSKLVTWFVFMIVGAMSTFATADWNAGVEAFKARDYRMAEAEFATVIRDNPKNAGGFYMLGRCRLALHDRAKAIVNLRTAYQLDPDNPTYVITLATAEYANGNFGEAFRLLKNFDITKCDEFLVYPYRIRLAKAAIKTNRPELAIEIMNQHRAEFGETAEMYQILGWAHQIRGRAVEAARAYARAFELDTTDLQSARLAVKIAAEKDLMRDSSIPITRVLELAARRAATEPTFDHFRLVGEMFLAAAEYRQASGWFEKALAEQPDNPLVLYLSALPLSHLGRSEEASARLSRALGHQPSLDIETRILTEMAKIAEQRLDWETAADRYRKAGNEQQAQKIEELQETFAEPLAERRMLDEQVQQLTQMPPDTLSDVGRQDAANRSRTISGLAGNIAMIDEEIEQARAAVKVAADPTEAKRILQNMSQHLRTRVTQLQPEDLGLTPLDIDELVVIVRAEDASPNHAPTGPPVLSAVRTRGNKEIPLPLRHTDIKARITAYIASVEVTQQYHNPYDEKIEAVYAFPLPHDASANEFVMTIGERKIRGIIRERKKAEQIYKEARRRGHVASLLTQERANIFTQRIANIEPQKDIEVTLTYFNTIPFRDGGYEFAFPTVIGPRFNPPGSTDPVKAAARETLSTDDATVHYLKPDEISSHDISLTVDLEAGVKIESLQSATHTIKVEEVSPTRRRVTFADADVLPNRDFVLRWQVSGDVIKSAFLTHEDQRGGFFTLVLAPPKLKTAKPRSPLEHVFVIDCSGSMQGEPLRVAKRAVQRVLENLYPTDTFQIIQFSTKASALGPRPVAATPSAIRRGLTYLAALESSGGTMMLEGIKAALDFPHKPGSVRLVSLMTDGFIGNEAEILAAVHDKLGASKIFSFGVGSAPNRFLLERMARMGQGAVAYVTSDDNSTDQAIDAFIQGLSEPVINDIVINWEDTKVHDVFPSRVPDLHASRPIVLCGRFSGEVGKYISLSGFSGGENIRRSVPLTPLGRSARPELANVWARMKIANLAERSTWTQNRDPLVADIRDLAVEYGILSKYTAFLAIDSCSQTAGDHGVTVTQAVPAPIGVRYDTTVIDEQ